MPRLLRPILSLVAVAVLCTGSAAAQQPVDATLTGTVTSAVTGQPIPDAHVFIANSLNGSVTNADGQYHLTGVPLGTLRLYVSVIGYEPEHRDLFIRKPGTQTFDFALDEAVVSVGEVTVTGEQDKKWRRQLEKFTDLFIGETPNAEQTVITNPEVLDFESKGGQFIARASAPLIIENRALGYRIQYFLDEFEATPTRTRYDGEPLFEEMSADSPEQKAMWKARRDSAFYGSFRHFMLALLNDQVEDQGFITYTRPARQGLGGQAVPVANQRYPLDASDIIKPGDSPDERLLDFEGFVEIVYTQEEEDPAYLRWRGERGRPKFRSSMITVENGPTVVDLKGDVLDPYGVTFYGYLAFERVADEVPKEYRPWL